MGRKKCGRSVITFPSRQRCLRAVDAALHKDETRLDLIRLAIESELKRPQTSCDVKAPKVCCPNAAYRKCTMLHRYS